MHALDRAGARLVDRSAAAFWQRGPDGLGPRPEAWRAIDAFARLAEGRAEDALADVLADWSAPEADKAAVRRLGEGFQAAPAERLAAGALLEGDLGAAYGVLDGVDRLVAALAAAVPADDLHLDAEVVEVRWTTGQVEARTRDGRTFAGAAAIVTLPVGVLQAGGVRFDPPLPAKEDALARLEPGSVLRLVLRLDRPLGELGVPALDEGLDAHEAAFLQGEGLFTPFWTAWPARSGLVVAWAGAGAAAALRGLALPDIVARALDDLAAITGHDPAVLHRHLLDARCHDWAADPFTRGAYTAPRPGGLHAPDALAASVDGTLFWAGEATFPGDLGTLHAAVASGERAAAEIVGS
jgi:monoamine oxidase